MFGAFAPGLKDGAAPALQEQALAAGQAMAADAGATRPAPQHPHPNAVVVLSLGQKVLHSWLQNRHQTRFPLVLNLRNNDPADTALLLSVIHVGLAMVGASEAGHRHAAEFVTGIGGTFTPALTPVLAAPDPHALMQALHTARLTAQAYAACAGALGRRNPTTRRYLDFMAARLDIPDEVARSINRRFAA